MKNYWTLYVTLHRGEHHKDADYHKFPFSSKEKADQAFSSWIEKAIEALGERLTIFSDRTESLGMKDANLWIDNGKFDVDVTVEEGFFEDTTPLDQEPEYDETDIARGGIVESVRTNYI